jgi:hypothetical protein
MLKLIKFPFWVFNLSFPLSINIIPDKSLLFITIMAPISKNPKSSSTSISARSKKASRTKKGSVQQVEDPATSSINTVSSQNGGKRKSGVHNKEDQRSLQKLLKKTKDNGKDLEKQRRESK